MNQPLILPCAGLGNIFISDVLKISFVPIIILNGIKFPPAAVASHKPKSGPLLLFPGLRNPLAKIVMASLTYEIKSAS